jgi:hypothetical protein
MIAIQRFHNLAQALMTVILLIPHIFVIPDLALPVERQAHQAVGRLAFPAQLLQRFGRVFLTELEDDLGAVVAHLVGFDHFGGDGMGPREDHGDAIPLPGDLVAGVAVAPGVVVDGFLGVYVHV